jgi:hypothetical protein
MTLKADGTNGIIQQYDYQVLTTAFTYTFAAGTTVLVINPAGTLATGTITFPAAPVDGMTVTFSSTQTITALTLAGNGKTIVSAATILPANQATAYVYRLSNTSWYPMSTVATNVPVAPAGGSIITSGTAQNSTSGTSIDFTSIPSWVKRITVNFNGVSLSGTAYVQVQLGDSGGVSATGYTGSVTILGNGGTGVSTALSAGFQTENHTYWVAASTRMGIMTITNVSGNIWTANWTLGATGTSPAANAFGGGVKTLTNTLDRLRITTTNGTDTFDAGSINILYE